MSVGEKGFHVHEGNNAEEKEMNKLLYAFYNLQKGYRVLIQYPMSLGRKIKVQFCTDPLSQVIHYETDR